MNSVFNSPPRLGLVGIGGYGRRHLSTLRALQSGGLCQLAAVADPFAVRHSESVAALKSAGAVVYDAIETLLAREDIDAVLIATPIPLHFPQACAALEAGKHVYLEKPPCVTLEELSMLQAAQKRAGKVCAIGFQQQSTPAMRFLKTQITGGAIGKLQQVWAGVRWRRGDEYYARAPWAGKWTHDGAPVFDGPATNALAHVVHAALFLSGAREDEWGELSRVRGALKRARPVESYDVAWLEAETASGVLVRLAFSHASGEQDGVTFRCTGEAGRAVTNWNGEALIAPSGAAAQQFDFECESHFTSMLDFLRALRNPSHRVATTLDDCVSYLQLTNGVLQSSRGASNFETEIVRSEGEANSHFTVAGLDEQIAQFADNFDAPPALLFDSQKPWLQASQLLRVMPESIS